MSAAYDFYGGGQLMGVIIGCVVGGLATIELGGAGCLVGARIGTIVGPPVGAAVGYGLGGTGSPYADLFQWMPPIIIFPPFL